MTDKSEVTRVGTLGNTSIQYTCKVVHTDAEVTAVVAKLHHYGHGLARGLSLSEHYWRVLSKVLGCQHILGVFDSTGELVGGVSFYPQAVEDCHYVESVLYTDFFVLVPGHSEAMPEVMRSLRKLARSFGAGRLAISRGESYNSYRTTYHKVGTL